MSHWALFVVACVAAMAVSGVCGRKKFNFNFKPEAPRHRVDFQAQGGGNNRRNFNVGGGVRGEYDVYRGKGGSRVIVSGGVADGLSRVDGKTYHGKPQTNVGIKVEVPFKG
ncbi:uncharacterized protein LOC144145228 [Haemaphysalis longicornis]